MSRNESARTHSNAGDAAVVAEEMLQFERRVRGMHQIVSEKAVYRARRNRQVLRFHEHPRLIDLFSGAGGLTLGFTDAFGHCFEPVWAIDHEPCAVRTYNANFGEHCIEGDINDILESSEHIVPLADVVIGGPPCQGFSLLNRNRIGDPRKELWRPFMEIVEKSGACLFLMENVPQLLSSPQHAKIKEQASQMGFWTTAAVLTAADYGAPQTRRRAFVLGCSFADPNCVFPPMKTHYRVDDSCVREGCQDENEYTTDAQPWNTVREAIGDLEPPRGTEIRKVPPPYDLHFGRRPTELSKKRYRAIPEEGMNRFDLQRIAPELTPACWIRKKTGGTDLFGRLWWDRPAFTIRTEFYKPEKGRYLHPEQHRPITHREGARFQTFPDSFRFMGTKIEIARQIGNAVPPILAARIADVIFALWLRRPRGHD
jgi:DNA (cytosine-5)-methyltransferase 1